MLSIEPVLNALLKKIISEFGVQVISYDGSLKYLPTIDFIIREDAPIIALAEGEISRIFYQENANDWEIGYDHLVDLQVEMGEIIEPGYKITRIIKRLLQ